MEFTTRTSDGLDLKGRYWPNTSGETQAVLALVHGFGEHSGRYDDMATHLNAQGIAVVAIDLRGHGHSPGPRGVVRDYDDFRTDLAALLDQAREFYPTVPLILFGHSMGGGVVLDHGFHTSDSVIAVIATAPLIRLPEPPSRFVRGVAALISKIRPKAALSQPIDGGKISTLPEEQARYEGDPLNHGKLGFGLARAMIANGEAIAARAAEWDVPLLLIHSEDDALTDFAASKDFAAKASHVEFHAVSGVAHEVHNDTTREQVYALIANFVLDQAKASAT